VTYILAKLFGKDINKGILFIGLLILTMIWILLYVYTVKNEFNLLNAYFNAEKIHRYQANSWILGGVVAVFFDIWGGSTISINEDFTAREHKRI